MAHLLTEADFRGTINVSGTEQTTVQEELCRFIAKYEPRILRAVLGQPLYAAFVAGAAATTHDQRWEDLWNGTTWTYNGQEAHWEGLKTAAASYVYYWYMRYLVSLTTNSGEKIAQADNASPAEVNQKAIDAWNDMSRLLIDLRAYLGTVPGDDSALLYPEWDGGVGLDYFSYRPLQKFRPINQWGI